jgi:hypothetical protein
MELELHAIRVCCNDCHCCSDIAKSKQVEVSAAKIVGGLLSARKTACFTALVLGHQVTMITDVLSPANVVNPADAA